MYFKKLIVLFCGLFLLFACADKSKNDGSNKRSEATYIQSIDSLEKVLYAKTDKGIDRSAALATIGAYAGIVKDYPSTKLAAEYLFKAGEISSSLNYSTEAIGYFKAAYDNYPDFNKASYCLFLQAFIYENQLHQLGEAAHLYNEVIKKFPNEKIAQDAQACLNNLGKTDEELIKEFDAKNKKSS